MAPYKLSYYYYYYSILFDIFSCFESVIYISAAMNAAFLRCLHCCWKITFFCYIL